MTLATDITVLSNFLSDIAYGIRHTAYGSFGQYTVAICVSFSAKLSEIIFHNNAKSKVQQNEIAYTYTYTYTGGEFIVSKLVSSVCSFAGIQVQITEGTSSSSTSATVGVL